MLAPRNAHFLILIMTHPSINSSISPNPNLFLYISLSTFFQGGPGTMLCPLFTPSDGSGMLWLDALGCCSWSMLVLCCPPWLPNHMLQ